MKIAVISDIHGNRTALDAVLNDIKNEKCESVLCLGDLALGGYDENYTVHKIEQLGKSNDFKHFYTICGNTDLMLLDYSDRLFAQVENAAPCMAHSMAQDVKALDADSVSFLKTLPKTFEVEFEGVKIFMCHGSPRRIDERLFPDMPRSEVEEAVREAVADIIVCGHTHIPCGFQLESGKTVLNVGSVGRSLTDDRQPVYAIIDIKPSKEFEISHKKVKYDNIKASELIRSRNFKDCNTLADMYIKEKK